jgi:hypothetical protein
MTDFSGNALLKRFWAHLATKRLAPRNIFTDGSDVVADEEWISELSGICSHSFLISHIFK